jgi:hypothetical protein
MRPMVAGRRARGCGGGHVVVDCEKIHKLGLGLGCPRFPPPTWPVGRLRQTVAPSRGGIAEPGERGVLLVSKRPEGKRSALEGAASGMALAFEFVGAVFLFWLLGWLVDGWLDTRPWGQVVGSLAGWAGGTLHVYYAAQRRQR